ncbi:glucose-6-phosphate isomerase [Alcaligenaceae bacterium CGII-47]|nr:glucose-6-phosphate isomerase [Alcaligenaceae bacterium CGII-47]
MPNSILAPIDFPALTALPQWKRFTLAAQTCEVRDTALDIVQAPGLEVDFSGQRHSPELLAAGRALIAARGLDTERARLLAGEVVNITEGRAAWHTALRAPDAPPEVQAERARMDAWVRRADTERRWRNIVHIGIGGSDWGVRLAVGAFGYAGMWRQVRFVANIDGHAIEGGLAGLDPRETLVVLVSKSFTTAETLQNAARAREWLAATGVARPDDHFVAVTARADLALAWGVPAGQVFRLWDWVGGRFSLWSAVSLTTALAVGSDILAGMQAGAAAMDNHFVQAPPDVNAPIRMALAGIVNRSVLGQGSLNIAPYDSRLANLVPYVQQLEMESLGKSVDLAGHPVSVPTGPAVWGMPGTDAQHTFFQWLHQGSDGAPVDFILCQEADHHWPDHHRRLIANCLAQREALMRGKSLDEALVECEVAGEPPDRAAWLARHRVHPGGRPNHLIVLPRLSPYSLGALLALYEHKVFVQALVWGINPFDQWGVEYGKVLAQDIVQALEPGRGASVDVAHDLSTHHWIDVFRG